MPLKKKSSAKSRARRVTAPAAKGVISTSGPITVVNKDGNTEIRHREYVCDIYTDDDNVFAYDVFVLNPADPLTFPYLSVIATRFESFRFKMLKSSTSPLAPTSASGGMLHVVDFDSQDNTNFATKTNLYNTGGKGAPIWQPYEKSYSVMDLQRVGPFRFVGENTLEGAVDRLSSAGNLFVCTTGSNVGPGVAVAELWIEYHVEFRTPVLHDVTSAGLAHARSQILSTSSGGATTTNLLAILAQGLSSVPLANDFHVNSPVLASVAGSFPIPRLTGTLHGAVGPALGGYIDDVASWYLPSGTAVTTNTPILRFVKDFVGFVELVFQNTVANNVPDVTSMLVSFLTAGETGGGSTSGNGAGSQGRSAMDLEITETEVVPFAVGASAFSRILMQIAAPAHSAALLTVPSFGSVGTQSSINVFPTPISLSAFREHRDRKLLASGKSVSSHSQVVRRKCSTREPLEARAVDDALTDNTYVLLPKTSLSPPSQVQRR